MQLLTVGLLFIQNRKLLLAFSKNKQCFYLPGGKIGKEETAVEALCREIKEELNINLAKEKLRFYTHISAPAFGEATDLQMEQDCFLTKELHLIPVPAAEIEAIRYFTLAEYLREKNQAPGAVMILQQLQQENRID